jgi:hypothetical protein
MKVYVMQSAHTDIGYTHPQEQIARMYAEHYNRVLELCRKTANNPPATRFKWTCETFWQVKTYLNQRPERLEEFLSFVRAGQIEVTASYFHFTDLIDTDAYRRSIQEAVQFCQQHNIPLRVAMHCDINGWPWSVADILSESNIPYFCSQVHIDNATDPLGARGSVHYHWLLENPQIRPDASIRVPQAFYWGGPQGGKVLHWLNEHYLLGNVLGVSSPQPFGADKTRYFYETDHLTASALYEVARRELPKYVERLQAAGYGHDVMLLSTGGYYVDNSRPDDRYLEVIERWNVEHDDISLQTATIGEWFDVLESQKGKPFAERQVAWPDHWAHGLGSSTAHIAQARRTQRRRGDVANLVTQSGSEDAAAYLDLAFEQERLSLEHTFDAWSTSYRPEAAANHFQQIAKELTFHRAELYFDEAAGTALRHLPQAADGESRLYVPASAETSELRAVHFNAGDQSIDPETTVLVDANDQTYPIQHDNERLLQFMTVAPIHNQELTTFSLRRIQPDSAHVRPRTDTLELSSAAWRLRVDPATGGLASLMEQNSQREWVAQNHHFGFGQLVHEMVVHPQQREAVGNVARWLQLGMATEETRRRFPITTVQEQTSITFQSVPQRIRGAVYDAVLLSGHADHIGQVNVTWRCYHQLPVVELLLDWHKSWCELPEAAYVAFPFSTSIARLELETGGGFFQPGSHANGGQLAGTVSSYYTIQRAARLTDGSDRLLWLPLDAPLVMPQEVKYDRWETDEWQWNGLLASMPVNHYWHTNFPTSQRGYIRLRYRFINPALFASDEAAIQTALPLDAYGWR